MKKSNVVSLAPPGPGVADVLTEIVRGGARELLAKAVEAEVEEFVARYRGLRDEDGQRRVVRNGYLPEREVQTGIGAVEVRVPRVRDRTASGEGDCIRFSSSIVPRSLRRSRSLEEFLPYLYLKGVSTGDFQDALQAILGPDAPGLSPATICRLKKGWTEDYEAVEVLFARGQQIKSLQTNVTRGKHNDGERGTGLPILVPIVPRSND